MWRGRSLKAWGRRRGRLMFARSLDCGATWSAPKEIGRIPDPDVNNDGTVTAADQAVVQANFGRRCGQANFNPDADVTGDCLVNVTDLAAVSRALGQSVPAAPRIAQGAAVAIAPTSGALHIVWRQFNNNTGHRNALYAVRSTDGGRDLHTAGAHRDVQSVRAGRHVHDVPDERAADADGR